MTQTLKKFISTYDNPRGELTFANKGTTHFSLEQDRALLCAVDKAGYGNWEKVREMIRQDKKLKFQHSVQGMTTAMIIKRADYRIRQVERELEARERTLEKLRSAAFVASQKTINSIKAMEKYDVDVRTNELQAEEPPSLDAFEPETKSIMEESRKDLEKSIHELRKIEGQYNRCLLFAEQIRQGIIRGDQNVNLSNISLKGFSSLTLANGHYKFDVVPDIESGAIEERINRSVLAIEECGLCENCVSKGRGVKKLCLRRLDKRQKLIANETKIMLKFRGMSTTNFTPGLISTITAPPTVQAKSPPVFSSSNNSKKRKKDSTTSDQGTKQVKKKKVPLPSASLKKKSLCETFLTKSGVEMVVTKNGLRKKPRIQSQGNVPMSISDEAFPDFCRRIGPYGTERMKLINEFAEDYPDTSVRQITLKFSEITCRDPPACIDMSNKKPRPFVFYLRPRFYKHLRPEDRPGGWEIYAEEDDILWEAEIRQKRYKQMKNDDEKQENEKFSSSNVSRSLCEG